jgi:exopolyphosphatase / guanosine-5'-triphosphate,3'-diphosphate pyrophosphatase
VSPRRGAPASHTGVRRAAIDIGTNSVRLLVADVEKRAGKQRVSVVDRALEITRLGEGFHAGGLLNPDAAARTAAAVERYACRAETLGAMSPVIAATYALRAARNPDLLLGLLRAPVRVLTGDEEAALGFLGAIEGFAGLDRGEPVLVLDVGGGSVELSWGTAEHEIEGSCSFPVGCVVMTQRFIAHDPPHPEEIAALKDTLAATLDAPLATLARDFSPRPRLIGVGGTVTTLAAMAQRLVSYDPDRVHGFVIGAADVERLFADIRALPLAVRRRVAGLQPERADVIIAGTLVVRQVLAWVGGSAITASETDLLWALVAGLSVSPAEGGPSCR